MAARRHGGVRAPFGPGLPGGRPARRGAAQDPGADGRVLAGRRLGLHRAGQHQGAGRGLRAARGEWAARAGRPAGVGAAPSEGKPESWDAREGPCLLHRPLPPAPSPPLPPSLSAPSGPSALYSDFTVRAAPPQAPSSTRGALSPPATQWHARSPAFLHLSPQTPVSFLLLTLCLALT